MRFWVVLALAAGCVGSTEDTSATSQQVAGKTKCKPHKKHADCGTATATIDINGGTVTTDTGVSVTIPYGALDTPTTITVTTTTQTAPSGGTSPVYEFGPEGTVFAKPLTVTLPLPAGVTTGTVYWSQLGSTTAFDPIGGTIDLASSTITAQTFHFSLAYIGEPSPTRTVSGGGSTTYITSEALTNVPTDFSTTPVGAIVGDGNGGYLELAGSAGSAAGLFEIPNVPSGEYIAHTGSYYMVTSSNAPDLGIDAGGRSNRVSFNPDAELDLTLTNLAPWDIGSVAGDVPDQIEWFSSEADDWDFGADGRAPLNPGQTTVTLPIDMQSVLTSSGPASEILSTDHAAAGQLVLQHTTSGVPYLAMQRVAQFPAGFSISSGQTEPVTLTMSDVSLGTTLSIDYRGDAMKQVVDTYGNPRHVGPGHDGCPSEACGGFAGALAQAWTANEGFYAANADLLLMFDDVGQHIVTGDMHYADPAALGGTWGVQFSSVYRMRTAQQLPGTCKRAGIGGGLGFVDYVQWTTTLTAAQSEPVTAKTLPPANIQVNGLPFFDGGHDLGGTATLTWTDPNDPATTGTVKPAFFGIDVIEVYVDATNRSHGVRVAHVSTPETSFTFFPYKDANGQTQSILQAGHSYVFTITAFASTSGTQADVDRLASAPFKSTNQLAEAGVSSGIFGDNQGAGGCLAPIQANQSYPLGTSANATNIFWVERGQAPWDPPTARNAGNIWTANLDGTNPHIIASGQDEPFGIAAVGNTIYWTNQGDGGFQTGAVMQMDLTTSTITQVTTATNPGDIDSSGGDVYWVSGEGTTRLSGGALSSVTGESGISLDVDGTNLYLANYGAGPPDATGTVDQLPLAGGATTQLASGQPQTFDVHSDGTYVYWSNQAWLQDGQSTINRTPIGGGPIDTLVTGDELQKYFAVDANNIYFVDNGAVHAVPKAGGPITRIATLLDTPGCPQAQLTIAAGALYFTDTCGSMGTYRVPLP